MASVLLAATELSTRLVINPSSQIQRRVETERRAALALRPAAPAQPRTLLLAGNSLLLHSVDIDLLNGQIQPEARATRFVIESTFYWDWYFGLQRLLDEGARPDRIVVVLSPYQILSNDIRNNYFAYYLMRARDVASVANSASLHPTVASQLLFARFSLFYGIRSEIRKHLLTSLLPGLEQFAAMLTARTGAPSPPPGAEQQLRHRIQMLQQLSRLYSVPISILIPPSGCSVATRSFDPIVARLAAESPAVVVALPSSETVPSEYYDGFHANAQGCRRHTLALAAALRR